METGLRSYRIAVLRQPLRGPNVITMRLRCL